MAKRTTATPAVDSTDPETPELDLGDALETAADETPEEESLDDDPEVEETETPQTLTPDRGGEQMVPISRLNEERTRAELLARTLDQLRQSSGAPAQATPATPAEPELDANLTPEAQKWAKFIRTVMAPVLQQTAQQSLAPLQRDQLIVKEMIDDQTVRRQYRDYADYEADIAELRDQWYRTTGVIAPREVAYHMAKGRRQAQQASTTRTQAVRRAAKPSATTEAAPPQRKAPAQPALTLDQVANMTAEEAGKWLAKNAPNHSF